MSMEDQQQQLQSYQGQGGQTKYDSLTSAKSRNDNDSDEEQYLSGDDTGDRRASKRQKLTVSCELCKQRKVKCDRGQPACGWCTRNGAVCEYKERKKPGLRAGYGRELEQRLDRLEEILSQHSQILSQTPLSRVGITAPTVRDIVRNSSPSAGYAPSPSSTIHTGVAVPTGNGLRPTTSAETTQASQHMNEPALLPQYQQESIQQDFDPSLSSMQNQATTAIPNSLRYASSEIPSPASYPQMHDTQSSADDGLPPYDLLYALVDLYFKHINTWSPILCRRTTLDLLFGSGSLIEEDMILLHAIVATTIRFSVDPRLTQLKAQHYHDVCKQKVLLYGLENSSVKSLQALVILALDLVGSSNGPPGWNILALITRAVVQLGLAVETSSVTVSPKYPSIYTLRAIVLPEPKDWREDESRRRLFWMVYLLDRYATISTAFEFALSETEIDRRLPCRDVLFAKDIPVKTRWFKDGNKSPYSPDQPENLGSFAYYIEVLGILSDIHIFLKQRIDISALDDVERWQGAYRKLDNALTEWKFNLPAHYSNMARLYQADAAKSVGAGWIMLQATYHTAIIRLHSSAAYPTTRSPIFAPSYSASQRCHTAVENIVALSKWVVANDMLTKLGPPFAFTLWVAARLLLVHGSTIEHKLSPDIHVFVDNLQSMGQYWGVAQRYAQIIQRVLDEYEDNAHMATESDDKEQGSVVKILADMRRTAYDLDVLISRHPRRGESLGPTNVAPSGRPPPAANELEYLDVFDFFNYPRLPFDANNQTELVGQEGTHNANAAGAENQSRLGMGTNEFNITNFVVDADSDWLFKSQS